MIDHAWKYSAGEKGCTVTVYERRPGGVIYARCNDPSLADGKGGYRRVSLGHRDRNRAKSFADRQAAQLREGVEDMIAGRTSLGQVFAAYRRHRMPTKSEPEQRSNERQLRLWLRCLGPEKDPLRITLQEWEAFVRSRASGNIDAQGNSVPLGQRRPIRARSVQKDCAFLGHILRWASNWRTPDGRYLLPENPVRGFKTPSELNPLRPVASQDRFNRLRAVSDQVTMKVHWNGCREVLRSYLSEILDVVNGTGRRISAVCQLRYEDLRLDRPSISPHGAIRWPASTDKMGFESSRPVTPRVRAALDRIMGERPGLGSAPLFPSPGDPTKPLRKEMADKWLARAEELAGLEPQLGGLWHPFRRKWATERKHWPDADVAAAGGWRSLDALRRCYMQADDQTILKVVLERGELREAAL